MLLPLKPLTSCPCIHLMHSACCSLSPTKHLHENRPTKRAGEAGKALRANLKSTLSKLVF
ncbi:hypothetical protein FML64_25430 [Klebsiella quasipneumoniae]|nr:hypothetical protein [Klebsiella pneumoniae]MBZ7875697.1 hypothetical protein [Klebsiella quasipneumoniae]EIW9157761.1 hypothetical protein [Klebsiella pneumoniae]EIW9168915.1 hypothetical protein [Klebsiella pneumoniae]MQA50761.1 hypothetical protein [Klebsiella pneumoniae]